MNRITIIELNGRAVAAVAGGEAIIRRGLTNGELAHVQAMAVFALEIEAGERPGPYSDGGAERHARRLLEPSPPPLRRWPHHRRPIGGTP